MTKKFFLPSLAAAALLCGCDKETKINTEKIEILSQKMLQLQQSQAKQMALFQTQLTSLAPMLDKMNSFYFEKTHDDALFYHTNTLYLLLTVDKNIESELRLADTEREAQNSQAYNYHTNEMDATRFYAAQIQDAMTAQESRIEDEINAETSAKFMNVSDELAKQIKLSAPDATEAVRLKEMEADMVQIKRDIDQIELQLAEITNQPAARP